MIKLQYMNNICREDIGEMSLNDLIESADIQASILQKFQDFDHKHRFEYRKLHIKRDTDVIPLCENSVLQDGDSIIYCEIVPPNNAYEYDRKDGIVYFFHISEKGHLSYPHIHARYAGDEISIYFSNFRVVGDMKSKTKMKLAIAYVKQNIEALREEWNSIMKNRGEQNGTLDI